MKPKIIIETLALLGNLSGIGRYTYEISKCVSQHTAYNWNFFYGYTSQKLISAKDSETQKYIRSLITKNVFIKKWIRKSLYFFIGIFSSRYDLYWQPNFIPTKSIKAKKVIATVHDFSWELYAEFQPKERVNHFKDNFYKQITKCDHIITGSYFTKEEIIQRVKCSPDKISVIYHGINHTIFHPNGQKKFDGQKYILAVGSIEPRKNLKNLLLAYTQFEEAFKARYHLYLVGDKGWNNDEIISLIEGMKCWVHPTGFVNDEKLAEYYRNASIFVYPSFYEGFGIPPLEAMACGTAVVISNTSTLPEVCSDAALYCNPHDVNDIKEKIEVVLSDEALRKELISRGLEHAKKFSWEKSAKEHLEIFQKVLAS